MYGYVMRANGITLKSHQIIPGPPPTLSGVVAIAAGHVHQLALTDSGDVISWGGNPYGQASVPDHLGRVRSLAAGQNHSLALQENGKVVAWGTNSNRQTDVPPDLIDAVDVFAGGDSSAALLSDGSVVLWGLFAAANGSRMRSRTGGVIDVALGEELVMILDTDGDISGRRADLPSSYQPVEAETSSGIVQVSGGSGYFLALKDDGTVTGSGRNDFGQASPPRELSGIKSVAAGAPFAMALTSKGLVETWGHSDIETQLPPVGLRDVVEIAAGTQGLALKGDGTLVSWGNI